MKHLFLRTLLLLALAGGCQTAWADEVEAMFLVAELQSGKTESVMLTNDADADVPRLLNKERVIIIGGQRYSIADVKGLRLEKRMVDGIETVATPDVAPDDAERQTVYDLQGRKVEKGSQNWENLPKGVYIVNGRKVVVR